MAHNMAKAPTTVGAFAFLRAQRRATGNSSVRATTRSRSAASAARRGSARYPSKAAWLANR